MNTVTYVTSLGATDKVHFMDDEQARIFFNMVCSDDNLYACWIFIEDGRAIVMNQYAHMNTKN